MREQDILNDDVSLVVEFRGKRELGREEREWASAALHARGGRGGWGWGGEGGGGGAHQVLKEYLDAGSAGTRLISPYTPHPALIARFGKAERPGTYANKT